MNPELARALETAGAVRFLCTGNAVRSAFAELYARHLGCPVPVDSAATVFRNTSVFDETRLALTDLGVDEASIDAFAPHHLDSALPPAGEPLVVFGMTAEHLAAWRASTSLVSATFLLRELEGVAEDIADPVLDGTPFDVAFQAVARCVEILVVTLATRSPGTGPVR